MMFKYNDKIYWRKDNTNTMERLFCTDSSKNIFHGYIGYKGDFSRLYKNKQGNIFIAKNINGLVYIWRYDSSSHSFVFFKSIHVDKRVSGEKN
jgi:hypothetical protein